MRKTHTHALPLSLSSSGCVEREREREENDHWIREAVKICGVIDAEEVAEEGV